jgi:dephospho-CoA kinase
LKVIGLTGGIGSGKTTVAMMFGALGAPVYIADSEAKKLSDRSKIIKRKLIHLLGPNAYKNDVLNRAFVAEKIFKDTELLKQVNAIVHPKVAAHFNRWKSKQRFPYCIKEAAILFENGGYKNCDMNILVMAPKEIRIKRLLLRDGSSEADIESRMSNQWSDAKKKELADIIIMNTDLTQTQKQVNKIHNMLISSA